MGKLDSTEITASEEGSWRITNSEQLKYVAQVRFFSRTGRIIVLQGFQVDLNFENHNPDFCGIVDDILATTNKFNSNIILSFDFGSVMDKDAQRFMEASAQRQIAN